jgi:hypothetical protein
MTTEGIEAVFLTTRNWGKSARFFQALGFELEFETGHSSGQFRKGTGPFVFVAEIPDQEPGMQLVVRADKDDAADLDPVVEVVTPFEDTHYGTREMTVRDPDGRLWTLRSPSGPASADGHGHGHGHGH